ncbi:MAG: citrate synthase [Actinomycetota bacterium]|nr:citrate synthase [Actinomycetota bacterium]
MPAHPPPLTTAEVAQLLGVKPATVYAYVSRGLLGSRRNGDGKNSLFDRREVDAFLAARKHPTTPGIRTGITLISNGTLHYRGHDATALARVASFEEIVALLWTGTRRYETFAPDPRLRRLAEDVIAPLPGTARHTDRLRLIVAAAAAGDPLRFDTTPAAVIATSRALLGTMVAALPPVVADFARDADAGAEDTQARLPRVIGDRGQPQAVGGRIAEVLWGRLTGWEATPREHNLLDAALVLLADHDIAASTLAARVAASTRAHPYAVVGAGLAALDGPLHGAASSLAYPLLAGVLEKPDPVDAIAERLRAGEPVPGFGHRLYPDGDPRARALLEMLGDTRARDAAERLSEVMRARSGVRPNVDLALAAVTLEYGMPPDAGETIFAVARTAGWIAHALEEYADRPSRFRPSGDYAGQAPG